MQPNYLMEKSFTKTYKKKNYSDIHIQIFIYNKHYEKPLKLVDKIILKSNAVQT